MSGVPEKCRSLSFIVILAGAGEAPSPLRPQASEPLPLLSTAPEAQDALPTQGLRGLLNIFPNS